MRSISAKVLGVCFGSSSVDSDDGFHASLAWKVHGGHLLQRVTGPDKVRSSAWGRRWAGYYTARSLGKRLRNRCRPGIPESLTS